ncbi:unnamed protein product [Periconia digitata]|uniref:Zn(2)-C6 fungal-type domain-containing protein n=1 Tax=Periconia digitata TaxID=1303443 RepID=A0A9W4UBZ0_9PLEO|nr:unnamed protein product [Periconia digitata]
MYAERHGRRRKACDRCHQSKTRCSGETPCTLCWKARRECTYSEPSLMGRPRGSQNQRTLERSRRLESGSGNDVLLDLPSQLQFSESIPFERDHEPRDDSHQDAEDATLPPRYDDPTTNNSAAEKHILTSPIQATYHPLGNTSKNSSPDLEIVSHSTTNNTCDCLDRQAKLLFHMDEVEQSQKRSPPDISLIATRHAMEQWDNLYHCTACLHNGTEGVFLMFLMSMRFLLRALRHAFSHSDGIQTGESSLPEDPDTVCESRHLSIGGYRASGEEYKLASRTLIIMAVQRIEDALWHAKARLKHRQARLEMMGDKGRLEGVEAFYKMVQERQEVWGLMGGLDDRMELLLRGLDCVIEAPQIFNSAYNRNYRNTTILIEIRVFWHFLLVKPSIHNTYSMGLREDSEEYPKARRELRYVEVCHFPYGAHKSTATPLFVLPCVRSCNNISCLSRDSPPFYSLSSPCILHSLNLKQPAEDRMTSTDSESYRPCFPLPEAMRHCRPPLSLEPPPNFCSLESNDGKVYESDSIKPGMDFLSESADCIFPDTPSLEVSESILIDPRSPNSTERPKTCVCHHVQRYRNLEKGGLSHRAASNTLFSLATGKSITAPSSYVSGLPDICFLAKQYMASLPTPTAHRCAKDPDIMRDIANSCFSTNRELSVALSSIQHRIVGITYASGPGDPSYASFCNLIPLSGPELASTNRQKLNSSVATRVREEAEFSTRATSSFSSQNVGLAALTCADAVGDLDVDETDRSQHIAAPEKLLSTGLIWRGINAGVFPNARFWPTCSGFDFSDAVGFGMLGSVINDILGLAHDISMRDWMNTLVICAALGKPTSPSAEMLSAYAAFNRVDELPEPTRLFYVRHWLAFMVLHILASRYCAAYFLGNVRRTARNYVHREDAFTELDTRNVAIKDCHEHLLDIASLEHIQECRKKIVDAKTWPSLLSECFDTCGRGEISLSAATVITFDLENGLLYGLALNADGVLPGSYSGTSIMERVALGHREGKCCELL